MYNDLLPSVSTFEAKDTSAAGMIRTNYGVGTLPSAFGVKSHIVDGNMPWVEAVSKDEIKEIISKGVPDYRTGFGQRIIDTYEFYRETLSKYSPNVPSYSSFFSNSAAEFKSSLRFSILVLPSILWSTKSIAI